MNNIYLLKQELLDIYDQLEENGGELTPELELNLTINADDVKGNIKDYVNLTKIINEDLASINAEQKRLKALADKKKKALERVNNIILDAIDFFGETKKSGVKFIDYGTGVVSTRKSVAVETDDEPIKNVGIALKEMLEWLDTSRQFDVYDRVDEEELLDWISKDVEKPDGTKIIGYNLTENDLDNIKVNMDFNIPLKDLLDDTSKYNIVRQLIEGGLEVGMSTKVDKTELKRVLASETSSKPTIAKLVEHKTLVVK